MTQGDMARTAQVETTRTAQAETTGGRPSETRLSLAEAPRPGEVRMVEVGGHSIGLFNVDGTLYALADRCPHRGAPLCRYGQIVGSIQPAGEHLLFSGDGEFVRCPWHKWDFEISSGRSPVAPHLRVRRYAVRLEDDAVVVTLAAVKD